MNYKFKFTSQELFKLGRLKFLFQLFGNVAGFREIIYMVLDNYKKL